VVANSRAEDRANAEAESRADARDCTARVASGVELKATSLAGAEHAEDTAALMDSIGDILVSVNPTGPAIIEIRAEIDRYIINVAEFRAVVERYHPPTFDECMARATADNN
jgi:hypothetical protein